VDTPGTHLNEVLKKHGISDVTYQRWREKYGGLDRNELKRLRDLEKENSRLKQLVGDQALIIEDWKQELKKRGWG
jgi:putative transposase